MWRAISKRPSRKWIPVTVRLAPRYLGARRHASVTRSRYPADTGAIESLLAIPRPPDVRQLAAWCWTNCMPCTIPNAAIFWARRGEVAKLARATARRSLATVKPAPAATLLMPSDWQAAFVGDLHRPGRGQAQDRNQRLGSYVPWPGTGAACHGHVMGDPNRQNRFGVRQHPRPGGTGPFRMWGSTMPLPIALPSRFLGAGAAPQGGSGHAKGNLRAVVCTSTLDLRIDWGAGDK